MSLLGDSAQLIGACVLALNCWQSWRNGRRAKEIKTDVEVIKSSVGEIQTQTNGLNANLLQVTSDAKYAEGIKHGEEYVRRDTPNEPDKIG